MRSTSVVSTDCTPEDTKIPSTNTDPDCSRAVPCTGDMPRKMMLPPLRPAPPLPTCTWKFRPGAKAARSRTLSMSDSAMSLELSAVIDTGTSSTDSARLRAVTTISSRPAESSAWASARGAACPSASATASGMRTGRVLVMEHPPSDG